MRAAKAEIDEQLVRSREHDARRLGSDQCFEVKEIDQPALDQLRLGERRGHPDEGFVGEKHRTFRHGMHVTGESQLLQIGDQLVGESSICREPLQFVVGEAQRFEEVDNLLQTCGKQEAPLLW